MVGQEPQGRILSGAMSWGHGYSSAKLGMGCWEQPSDPPLCEMLRWDFIHCIRWPGGGWKRYGVGLWAYPWDISGHQIKTCVHEAQGSTHPIRTGESIHWEAGLEEAVVAAARSLPVGSHPWDQAWRSPEASKGRKLSAQLFHYKICDAALEKSELKGTGDQFGSVLNWEGRAGRGSSTRGVRKVCLEVQQLQHLAILYFISPMCLK